MRRSSLSDTLPMADWQRIRSLQRADPFGDARVTGPRAPTDDLPMDQWHWARERQVRGLAAPRSAMAEVRRVALRASQPATEVEAVTVTAPSRAAATPSALRVAKGPLTGRPGTAAMVAGAVKAIISGPNRSEAIHTKDFTGRVSRGGGRDVRAEGQLILQDRRIPLPVGASGVLEPPTGRAEVTVSGVKGRGVGLPSRVRIYTTPSGELDFDLPGPVRVGPFPILKKEPM